MKISELIKELNQVLETEGDLTVYVSESEYGESPDVVLNIKEPNKEKDQSDNLIKEKHLTIE